MKNKPKSKKDSEYTKLMNLSPEGHRLSICFGMAGLPCDIKTATLILNIYKTAEKMGRKFDLETACKIRASNEEKFNLF